MANFYRYESESHIIYVITILNYVSTPLSKIIDLYRQTGQKRSANTYRPQIRPLSDFMGLK